MRASKKLVTGPKGIMVAQTFCDILFNYFEKVLYENLTFEILPLWFLELSVEG
jgi:hypothetical protein